MRAPVWGTWIAALALAIAPAFAQEPEKKEPAPAQESAAQGHEGQEGAKHEGAGEGEGLARFAMQLPEAWRQRFLFLGVGGNAGALSPSANLTDRSSALGKGYTTILTDTGHVGDGTTAKWTLLPDCKPDTAKRVDFFHRAAHNVTVAGKAFAEAYYAAKVQHA